MKTTYRLILPVLAICLFHTADISAQQPDCTRNFTTVTTVLTAGAKDTAAVNALPNTAAARTVTYYDGLGFPSQIISEGAIQGGLHDLITHKEYDRYMRESRIFLPYADMSASGANFRPNAEKATIDFYSSQALTGMSPDPAPYSVTVYENSLLDRVMEQGFPGNVWQPAAERTDTSGRTAVNGYGTCRLLLFSGVKNWAVTGSGITRKSYYSPGKLVRRTYRDEDWTSGYNGTVDVYTDYNDNTVLERRWIIEEGKDKPLDTYYVYDELERLRYVLPPALSESLANKINVDENDPDMLLYAYVYHYNNRGECCWKRLPGCGPVSMLYDGHSRMVLSQDGNLAEEDKWTAYWYDGLGRPAVIAKCPLPYSGDISKTEFTAVYSGEEGHAGGYVLSPPLPDGSIMQNVIYYDSYDFIKYAPQECRDSLKAYDPPVIDLPPRPYVKVSVKDSNEKPVPVPIRPIQTSRHDRFGAGRVTGRIVWTSDPERSPLYSSYYYDERGDIFQSHSQNHLGGWETVKTKYSFTRQPVNRVLSHSTGNTVVTEAYTYTYDNMDRLLKVIHRLGDGEEVILADNRYDLLGRLASDARNGNGKLMTEYSYNIRQWLTKKESKSFCENLFYNDIPAGDTDAVPRYAGGISSYTWKYGGTGINGCNFFYDGLRRLTEATVCNDVNVHGPFSTSYTYDSQGNITRMTRGSRTDSGGSASVFNMEYNGNRLSGMTRSVKSTAQILTPDNSPDVTAQYEYDANGNMTRDINNGIAMMSYNVLNLPDRVTAIDGNLNITSQYLYSCDGEKMQVRTECPDGNVSVTDYCSNLVYRDGTLERIIVDGGYIEDGRYRFFVTDHLGSVRAVTDTNGNELQTLDYYPYGQVTEKSVSSSGYALNNIADSLDDVSQPYRFNGKESQEFAWIPYLDYGARYYSPDATRWTTMDPLAEKYYFISPYAFCSNNPVNFVDADGEDIYRYDFKTGQFNLFKQTNDPYDQIAKFAFNKDTGDYELKTNKKGKAKLEINKIEKGILQDGINFMENSQVWSTDNVSVEGFQDFIIQFSDMVGKEMAGYYYITQESSDIKFIHMGRGKNNRYNSSTSIPGITEVRPDLFGKVYPHTSWHTHPSYAESKMNPSEKDYNHKTNQSANGVKRFIILTGGLPIIEY